LLASLAYDPANLLPNNFKEIDSMLENAYTLYQKSNKSVYLIRCALYIVELYDVMERYMESA